MDLVSWLRVWFRFGVVLGMSRKGMKSSEAIDRIDRAEQFGTGSVAGLDRVSSSGGCSAGHVDGDTGSGDIQKKDFHFCSSTRCE